MFFLVNLFFLSMKFVLKESLVHMLIGSVQNVVTPIQH